MSQTPASEQNTVFPREVERPHPEPVDWGAFSCWWFFWAAVAFLVLFAFLATQFENNVYGQFVRRVCGEGKDWLSPSIAGFFGPMLVLLYCLISVNVDQRQEVEKKLSTALDDSTKEADEATQRLRYLLERSRGYASELPDLLNNAQAWLAQAERELHSNAFSPFWDAVQSAAGNLGEFKNRIKWLIDEEQQFRRTLDGRQHSFGPFPVVPGQIPDPRPTLQEFSRIVRQAQTDFQFANIWEHRQTRQVLIAGFENLGDAVRGLPLSLGTDFSGLMSRLS